MDAIKLNCGIRKAREDKVPRSQLVARAWRAQVHGVNQAWMVFCYSYTLTYLLVDRFRLGGSWRDFSPSSLVSSSITRLGVFLCLHLFSLLFKLFFYCSLWLNMAQPTYCAYLLLFHTLVSQSKSNLTVILKLGFE